MAIKLRQSTASQEVPLGTFVDSVDGVTPKTALVITNTDIRLWKNGATALATKASGGATHMATGIYYCVFDATDTNTVGPMVAFIHIGGALPVRLEFEVLPAAVYDSLVAGTSNVPADVIAISGDTVAADNLEFAFDNSAGPLPMFGIADRGTAQSITSTTIQLRAAAPFANDELIGATVVILTASTGAGQSRRITDYDGVTDTATVATWTVTPTGTITYAIYATASEGSGSGEVLDAAAVRAALGLASANLDTQLTGISSVATAADTKAANIQSRIPTALVSGRIDASVGAMAADTVTSSALATSAVTEIQTGLSTSTALATAQTGITSIQSRIPNTLINGRIDASVGAMEANVLTAAATAADFSTEINTGMATAASITTLTAFVDTEVAAIKAVTDKLDTALVLDGSVYQFTANAVELAPTGGSAPTAAAIADAVWDELLSGHAISGSAGARLSATSTAPDPWATTLPGAYGAGTAGKILGDNLNATVSSRATQTSVDTNATTVGTVNTNVAAIKTKTDFLPSAAAGANGGLPTVNASNQIAGIAGTITTLDALDTAQDTQHATTQTAVGSSNTNITAIKAKTDNLPADPADASDIAALFANVPQAVWSRVISTGFPAERLLRIIAAVTAGKTSLDGTVIRDVNDTQPMVTVSISGNNRTSVTYGS